MAEKALKPLASSTTFLAEVLGFYIAIVVVVVVYAVFFTASSLAAL